MQEPAPKFDDAMGGNAKKGPTGPTPATVKRLFALSRNLCAFPGCQRALVRESKVTGKVCHIRGAKGPRYDATQKDSERRAFENLVLLCAECHDVIDDPANVEKYSPAVLMKMKEQHEQKAETTLTTEMIDAFVRSASASTPRPSVENVATVDAPNNTGVIGQFPGATFNAPVIIGGTVPPIPSAEPAGGTTVVVDRWWCHRRDEVWRGDHLGVTWRLCSTASTSTPRWPWPPTTESAARACSATSCARRSPTRKTTQSGNRAGTRCLGRRSCRRNQRTGADSTATPASASSFATRLSPSGRLKFVSKWMTSPVGVVSCRPLVKLEPS